MVKKLGQGTYGSVFLCVQRDTGRQCVMKRMALSARQHQVLAEESAVLHGGWLWWIDGSHTIDEAHAPTAPRESPCRGLSPHVDFFSPLYPMILFGNHPQDFPARLAACRWCVNTKVRGECRGVSSAPSTPGATEPLREGAPERMAGGVCSRVAPPHTPFSPSVAPRFPHISEMGSFLGAASSDALSPEYCELH